MAAVIKKFSSFCLLLVLWPWIPTTTTTTTTAAATANTTTMAAMGGVAVKKAKPNCEDKCGEVDVPYPFGIHKGCAIDNNDRYFLLTCNRTSSPPKLIYGINIEVRNIDLENATMSVIIENSYDCYENGESSGNSGQNITLSSFFTFSNTENKLMAFGCDTLAYMTDYEKSFGSGCVSICSSDVNMSSQTSCSGLGCCQTSIPKHLDTLLIGLQSFDNHSEVHSFNPCGYAFLADQRTFDISKTRLDFWPKDVENSSVLLDWVVGNETCEEAKSNGSSYVCGDNTDCYYSDNGRGYLCRCSKGFKGNPYLKQGCEDIDECLEPETYKCRECKNTFGGYKCKCPLGMHGDGKDGNCQGFRFTTFATVIGASIFSVIIAILLFYDYNRRKREKIFKQNGGLVLKNQRVRIFSKAELAKATNNYNQSNFLGQGGFASVYKGVVQNETKTELEKDDKNNTLQINRQQFHEEIAIVSQVNHKNVVKLLGLCLEAKVPLLVYELVPNGTLSKHIHAKRSLSTDMLRPWRTRLRIATETALAIDYLHSLAHPPIIHRDIKSTNILLDENYTAKVSDFGASVLIPPGQNGIATTVQGTLGYLDPEYLTTGTLTTKSDVYSFGVVLMELITGERPMSNGVIRSGAKRNIIQYFVSTLRENKGEKCVEKIVDPKVVYDENHEREIEIVAMLAMKCLEVHGEKRPSMKEVAEELLGLNKLYKNNNAQRGNGEETEQLLSVDHNDQSLFSISHSNIENDQVVEYTTFDISGYNVESSISLN
ncbi:wall-associated receptor kinase 2-like [Humulus lupulus]|uniref:wall-associated receptor kinase 2-like n=1 Tax=Humulus lupulus TaxID=3486 RepID=UPI002B41215A|nr:wall-associated receptor kinase 2-like [Humulus lupulus]